MKLTAINLHSSLASDILHLSLVSTDPKPKYQIKGVAGLGAEEIIPRFYGRGLTATKFYDMSMRSRDVVLRLKLNPNFDNNETYSDLRDDLYRAIGASRLGGVHLHFYDGPMAVASLSGFISKFEVEHMVKSPEVTLTISCEDPMLRAVSPARLLYGTEEHPGDNPILIPDSVSTAPHGFAFSVQYHAASPTFTVADAPSFPTWIFQVMPQGGFVPGDILYFSSDYSQRYLFKKNGETVTHLIDKISPESVWPVMFPGQNTFYLSDNTKYDWVGYLQYFATFWGV